MLASPALGLWSAGTQVRGSGYSCEVSYAFYSLAWFIRDCKCTLACGSVPENNSSSDWLAGKEGLAETGTCMYVTRETSTRNL